MSSSAPSAASGEIATPSGAASVPTQTYLLAVSGTGRVIGTVIQLGLVLLALNAYQIESGSGVLALSWLIFVGFIINAALPLNFRPPFFLLLSWGACGIVLGAPAIGLIAVGLSLFGICHLPIKFAWRIALLLATGMGLALFRGGIFPTAGMPWLSRTLPVLGSMLMFRIVVYLYDLRHVKQPVSVWRRLSYFFLFPNVCFLLFPVVDYQTFQRSFYKRPAADIYQKGVQWIFRGVTHLLFYRVVYYYFSPAPAAVTGLGGVIMFVASAWLLFLHVSGLYHISVGLLCLFGFDLPETNKLYFLAASPNDIWKRANIYWKDFMMKIFYYPAFKTLQKRKVEFMTSIIAATMAVFVATAVLHSYQWFWIRGKFAFGAIDAAFWTMFAALVLANTLWDLRPGKKKATKPSPSWSWTEGMIHMTKIVGMFVLMSVMWSWWSMRDTSEWLSILSTARNSNAIAFLAVLGGAAAIVVSGSVVYNLNRGGWKFGLLDNNASYMHSAAVTSTGALLLLIVSRQPLQERLGDRVGGFISSLQTEHLNARDTQLQMKSYYETLMTGDQPTSVVVEVAAPQRPGAREGLQESDAVIKTHDELGYELIPSHSSTFRGVLLRTNTWGMRDDEYSLAKPSRTRRIALVGGSIVMGSGVEHEDIFEALLEKRLNREYASSGPRYEILNFAVGGYGVLQYAASVERKVFQLNPDVVILATLSGELSRTADVLTGMIADGSTLPPYVDSLTVKAGIKPGMKRSEVRRLLSRPEVSDSLQAWGYRSIVDNCRRHNVIPVWAYLPTLDQASNDSTRRKPSHDFGQMAPVARKAGFVVLDLSDAYSGTTSGDITLVPWDPHPNALGHKLLADRLHDVLIANDSILQLGLTPATRSR